MTEGVDLDRAVRLREQLADLLVADGAIESNQVEAAFRAVPRHMFAPEASLEQAYARERLVIKKDERGVTISSVTAPQIQAQMLEQAQLGCGMRVLEIGSGGYNAALMAELVGPGGEVTTLDIDREVAGRARQFLRDAGYPRVNVVVADGEYGCGEHAPFDRIVVTAGAWDIPPAWEGQLAPDGMIILPLRMRGLSRSLALARENGHLVAQSVRVCGFVDMQGAAEHRERVAWTRGRQVGLRFDDGEPPADVVLDDALEAGRAQAWSGVTVSRTESFDSLQLWLATAAEGFCLATVDCEKDSTLARPANRIASPAAVDGHSFAYLASRGAGDATVEFGAAAFGPAAPALAEALAGQVRQWDQFYRTGPGPQIAVYPARTAPGFVPGGLAIDKRHVRLTISWPAASLPAAGPGNPHDLAT